MFTSETQLRVRYADTDQMGVVYHSNYFDYFEVGRAEAIRQLGYTYAKMEEAGICMPIVDAHARFLRPALYDNLLTIKTTLKELPVHHKIEFVHEIYNEQNQLLCSGKVILYFVEKTSMKRAVIPEILKKILETYFTQPT